MRLKRWILPSLLTLFGGMLGVAAWVDTVRPSWTADENAAFGAVAGIAGFISGCVTVGYALVVFGVFGRLSRAQGARVQTEQVYTFNYDNVVRAGLRDATPAAAPSRREALAKNLLSGAGVDDLKATVALLLIPSIVVGGAVLTGYADNTSAPENNATLAYALLKRLGFLGVTFYLAHAAVSQYRYSTLRAAHYRACAQAISVCDDDASLVAVYKMLLPPHAFGTAPTSPVDALVKIANGKESKD